MESLCLRLPIDLELLCREEYLAFCMKRKIGREGTRRHSALTPFEPITGVLQCSWLPIWSLTKKSGLSTWVKTPPGIGWCRTARKCWKADSFRLTQPWRLPAPNDGAFPVH